MGYTAMSYHGGLSRDIAEHKNTSRIVCLFVCHHINDWRAHSTDEIREWDAAREGVREYAVARKRSQAKQKTVVWHLWSLRRADVLTIIIVVLWLSRCQSLVLRLTDWIHMLHVIMLQKRRAHYQSVCCRTDVYSVSILPEKTKTPCSAHQLRLLVCILGCTAVAKPRSFRRISSL